MSERQPSLQSEPVVIRVFHHILHRTATFFSRDLPQNDRLQHITLPRRDRVRQGSNTNIGLGRRNKHRSGHGLGA